jgi:hypothetical protein
MSLLFGVENQAPVSSRCSPETSCYSSSSTSITSKLCLVLRRGWAQRMQMVSTLRENSPSSKHLQDQSSTIWWMNTCPWHGRITTLQHYGSALLGDCLPKSQRSYLYPKPHPGQLAKSQHYHHVILGPVNLCMIKGNDITFF